MKVRLLVLCRAGEYEPGDFVPNEKWVRGTVRGWGARVVDYNEFAAEGGADEVFIEGDDEAVKKAAHVICNREWNDLAMEDVVTEDPVHVVEARFAGTIDELEEWLRAVARVTGTEYQGCTGGTDWTAAVQFTTTDKHQADAVETILNRNKQRRPDSVGRWTQ